MSNKKTKVKVYSAFDRPTSQGYDFFDPLSPVQQYFRDESDINNIVAYWSRTGDYNAFNQNRPSRYVDCSIVQDFESALNTLIKAEDILKTMSPADRLRFQDDPVAFIEHFSDPAHSSELEKLVNSKENIETSLPSETSQDSQA